MLANSVTGTRAANVLMRKRIALSDPKGNQLFDEQGRPRTWNLRTHRHDEMRMVSYVVPPGLADTQVRDLASVDDLTTTAAQTVCVLGFYLRRGH